MFRSFSIKFFFILLLLIASIWVASSINEYETLLELVNNWGYVGLGLIALISGFNLVAPVPAVVFIPVVVAAGLNFWIALAIVTIGMTIGDGIGIFLSKTGRSVLDEWIEVRLIKKVERFIKKFNKSPYVLSFLYAAFIPLPNELLIVPLSFLKLNGKKLLFSVFLGNIIFNALIAGGLVGITTLM